MEASKLYEEDFLLWTEQQARALRELGGSNTLDTAHLAEEIEDLGRRGLREVRSLIRRTFLHALKLAADPGDGAARHWAGEATGFQQQVRDAFAPSMRRSLDFAAIWEDAVRQFEAGPRPGHSDGFVDAVRRSGPPAGLDELVAVSFDVRRLVAAVAARGAGSVAVAGDLEEGEGAEDVGV